MHDCELKTKNDHDTLQDIETKLMTKEIEEKEKNIKNNDLLKNVNDIKEENIILKNEIDKLRSEILDYKK